MKNRIKGITYNTETAIEIESHNNYNTIGSGQLDSYEETLYNEDGRYFIYQAGGARTSAANNTPTGGTAPAAHIIPITEKEVGIWRNEGLEGVYNKRTQDAIEEEDKKAREEREQWAQWQAEDLINQGKTVDDLRRKIRYRVGWTEETAELIAKYMR